MWLYDSCLNSFGVSSVASEMEPRLVLDLHNKPRLSIESTNNETFCEVNPEQLS
jgi:hypothetical protein